MAPDVHVELSRLRVEELPREAARTRVRRREATPHRPAPHPGRG